VRKLGVFGLVSALMLAALVTYSCTFLKEFEAANKKIQDDYVAAVAALRATNLPKSAVVPKLEAKRFTAWLAIRKPLAAIWSEGLGDHKIVPVLLQRRLRNDSMSRLAEELNERSMSLDQYCAYAARWRAMLDLPEFRDLRTEWTKTVRTKNEPNGLPLPGPPTDATKAELALMRANKAALRETMPADLLTVILELVQTLDTQGPEPTQVPAK